MRDLSITMNASIECNNLAVTLLKAGKLHEALESFKTAARIMYPVSQYFQARAASSDLSKPETHIQDQQHETDKALKDARKRQDELDRDKKKIKLEQESFSCAEPIFLNHIGLEPKACTVESSAIVYNMALAYHLFRTTPYLQKALCLFDMSFSLAFSLEEKTPLANKIAMASLNNCGHIQHFLGNYALSRQYLDTLSSFILSLPKDSSREVLEERHYYLLNAMLLQKPSIAGAA